MIARPQLHVLVDPPAWRAAGVARLTQEVAQAGADWLHLRGPGLPAAELFALGREICAALPEGGRCRMVVNDRVDVALALGLHALQLPERSFAPAEARALLCTRPAEAPIIGASRHDQEGVRAAVAAGVDWVFLGHVYPTPSHVGAEALVPAEIEAAIAAAGSCPVFAIGGVQVARLPQLRGRGFAGVAVQRAALDPRGALAGLRSGLDTFWREKGKRA